MVPILETERLRLREFCESDLERWAAVMADAATVRYVGNQQLSREETWRRLLTSGGLWPMYGFGYWAAERKDDGLLVGHVGLAAPSIRLAERCGFNTREQATYKGEPILLLRRPPASRTA